MTSPIIIVGIAPKRIALRVPIIHVLTNLGFIPERTAVLASGRTTALVNEGIASLENKGIIPLITERTMIIDACR